MQELIVNEELRTLLPPQSDEELETLEKLLLEEGCRDPIVVWSGKNVIVDGMTRYRLCRKHEIEFRTTELKFANLSQVKLWIIDNQLARRNCTPTQLSYCFGSLYNSMKGKRGGDRKSKGKKAVGDTAKKIARQLDVSGGTILRWAKFAEKLDAAAEKAPEIKSAVLSKGGVSVANDELDEIAKLPATKAITLAKRIIKGQRKKPPKPAGEKEKKSERGEVGEPLGNFRGLQYAPLNEQGVVYLFGMVSRELGFLVESVRTGFPDCEGKRRVNPSGTKWEHVRIEFEYESKNFLLHGHDPNGCDVIVCWVDNWEGRKEGPAKNLAVLELKSEIERLSPK